MKKSNWPLSTIILAIALAMLFFAISCQKQDTEADIAAIKEMLNQYAVACNTGDFDLWISLWADDGIQMPPDTPTRIGKEQIGEGIKPAFDQMNLDIAIHSIEDAKVYGDLGLTRCTYTLKMTPKAGGETINAMPDGKALTLYEKQSDGSWKIVYDCFNSNTTPKQE
jgi:uncharacterized protein (TIGR02246 family)